MNIYKYSVIIPIYNAEKTLQRCIDSLLVQNYPRAEIILVNDGSADTSGEICREYEKHNNSVVYIEKINGGVSSARNAGLDATRGKYILFVDSDDYVSTRYFDALDEMCADQDYDCVFFSHNVIDGNSVSPKILSPFSSQQIEECIPKFCEALYRKYLNHPINKRYVRHIIEDNKIRFPEDLSIGEDKSFCLKYVMHCQSCLVFSEPIYNVSIENKDSLSRKPRKDLYQQFEKLDALTQQTICTAKIQEEYRQQFYAAENLIQLRAVYSESKRMHLAGRDSEFRRKKIRQMCCDINKQKAILPGGVFSSLLQIPVRLNMVTAIDLMGKYLAR